MSGSRSRWEEVKSVASGPAILLGMTASMGGFLFGADTGQISGFLIMDDYLRRFAQDRGNGVHSFSDVREGLIVGLVSLGSLAGAVLAAPFSDRIGRRKSMILACMIFCVGLTIQITAMYAWYQIAIGRCISGLGIGGLSVLVPVYQSETAPRVLRGTLIASYQLFITMGIVSSYCINLGTSQVQYQSGSWRGALACSYLWAGLLATGMFNMPESPRWLLTKGRKEEALKALKFIAGHKNERNCAFIQSEYQEMEARVMEMQQVGKSRVLYRTLLGVTLQSFQQLTGANYFFYYGASIFQSVGLSNSFVTQIILGGVNVAFTFPGLFFVEHFGRRKPLIFGGIWQCGWLIVFAAVGSQLDPNTRRVGAILITSACMFIAGFASSWGPGTWVAIGEMFPLYVRSYSASFATTGNWIWNFLLTFFTPFITSSIHFRYGYLFAGANLTAVLVVFFFYYESSGLCLEQIDEMYTDPNVKPWASSSWVPKGHRTRHEAAEAVKEDQVSSVGVRAEHEHLENFHPSARSSAGTRIGDEKEIDGKPQDKSEYIPQTNRGKFDV